MEKNIGFWDKIYENMSNMFNNIQKIIADGFMIYVLIIFAILIAIFIIYDKDEENPNKVLYSLTRCFRRLVILFADLFGDIISLFSSLSEIVSLIRILIFGKIDSQTQILLANYAIIFMSIVSYFTTMNGLKLVVDEWEAVLASFGVQVGILIFSGRLAQRLTNLFSSEKEKKYIYKVKCREEDEQKSEKCHEKCGNVCTTCSKVLYLKNGKADNSKSIQPDSPLHNNPGFKITKESILIIMALITLMSCSIFFSYNAFWEKYVLDSMALKEYTNVKLNIADMEESYSKSLKAYQQDLERVLQEYHNIVNENVDLNDFRNVDENIEKLESNIENLQNQIRILEEEQVGLDFENEEDIIRYNEIESEIAILEAELEEEEAELEEEEEALEAPGYTIVKAMDNLSAYYVNPLAAEVNLEEIGDWWEDLQVALAQGSETKDLFTSEQRTDLDIVFNNYLELCQYYRDNSFIGFKTYQLDNALLFTEIKGNKNTYEEETVRMLENAIKSFEQIPNFEPVNAVWNDEMIENTSKMVWLDQLYADYRDCSGMVNYTEKAIRELTIAIRDLFINDTAINERSKWMTLFVAILAFFVDFSIVLISIWKGNKYTNRSTSEIRRLVNILFVKKDRRSEEERRMQLSLAFGLLFGVLMFVVQKLLPIQSYVHGGEVYWFFILYCFCGILVALIIGKAIGRTKKINNEVEQSNSNPLVNNLTNAEERIREYIFDTALQLFDAAQWMTICIINKDTLQVEDELKEICLEVEEVKEIKWNIEFAILKSHKLVEISDDKQYYIVKEMFWKMLYANILDKRSGNLMMPLSVEDLMSYESTEESHY